MGDFEAEAEIIQHLVGQQDRERNGVKHEFVKKKIRTATEIPSLPLNPCTGKHIAERLLLKVRDACGYAVPYEVLAAHSGKSRSSLHRWYVDTGHRHLQTLVAQLELLSDPERQRFCEEVCRDLALLEHPRLAHDPQGVALLRALLEKPKGLTWILGARHLASFVLAALGHSFPRWDAEHRSVTGLSVHPSEHLVPMFGVTYLPALLPVAAQKTAQEQGWRQIHQSKSPLVLLDGVTAGPVDVLQLAKSRHVVWTGTPELKWIQAARRYGLALHAIKVTATPTRQAPITVREGELEDHHHSPR